MSDAWNPTLDSRMEMFYNELNAYTRMNEAYEILEKIYNNDYQYPTMRVGTGKRAAGTIELDAITLLTVQEYMAKNDIVIQSHVASLRALQNQIEQITNALNLRPQQALPSDIENPRTQGKEQCKAITLRSGTQLDKVVQDATAEEDKSNYNKKKISKCSKWQTAPKKSTQKNVVTKLEHVAKKMPQQKNISNLKDDHLYHFLSDSIIIYYRRSIGWENFRLLLLQKHRLKNKLSPKLNDTGSFTIPCSIGNHYEGKELCDLGASINIIPMSIFKKLGIGKARPTTMTLQLADGSYVHPKGKIKDALIRVDKFIFPIDFLILECKADHDVPIILGRPFLATGRTLIDVHKDELTMRVNDQQVTFNVFDALKCTDENEECHIIDFIEIIVG
ncbi:uncharacterized protein [Gossypium hirsutum]|uniref:Uncharacterized protein n=1 Tax=Gossypium hirsutum TaxID=3635 RepID=A0A1U8MMF3_GOSHI|nr:uncharacterized protein LOC107939213 [Gossypium hirsutum]